MEKSHVFAVLALASFLLILFTPASENYWIWFLILGVIFGAIWFLKK